MFSCGYDGRIHTQSCSFAEEHAALWFSEHAVGCVTHSSQLDGPVWRCVQLCEVVLCGRGEDAAQDHKKTWIPSGRSGRVVSSPTHLGSNNFPVGISSLVCIAVRAGRCVVSCGCMYLSRKCHLVSDLQYSQPVLAQGIESLEIFCNAQWLHHYSWIKTSPCSRRG